VGHLGLLIADVSWWWFGIAVGLTAILGLPTLIACGVGIGLLVSKIRSRRRRRASTPTVQFVHYIDESGLRSLGAGLHLELPTSRKITRSHKLSGKIRNVGAERGRSEVAEFAASFDLARFVEDVQSRATEKLASGLTEAPYIRDEAVLAEVAARLGESLGETSQTRELLQKMQEAYEIEKTDAIAKEKRGELAEVARGEKLVLLVGTFARGEASAGSFLEVANLGVRRRRRYPDMRHMDPREARYMEMRRDEIDDYYSYAAVRHDAAAERDSDAPDMPMPQGVAIRVMLPDADAFTASGRERIDRGDSFYGNVLAHSPSFDPVSGVFVCSAYAVWGSPVPS
jgi:hypothetical protein